MDNKMTVFIDTNIFLDYIHFDNSVETMEPGDFLTKYFPKEK